MKPIVLVGMMLFGAFQCFSQKSVTIQLKWKFIHVIEGYDHDNRVQVFIDNKLSETSETFVESKVGNCSFDVSPGRHTVKMLWFAYYEGNWEEHTVENDFSIEAVYEFDKVFTANDQLGVIWDIDADAYAAPIVTWGKKVSKLLNDKAPKATKAKVSGNSVDLTVNWLFKNVIEGYDHQTRIVVYADGVRLGQSETAMGSEGGNYTFSIPKKTKKLVVVTESNHEGNWEENTIENEYSNNAIAQKSGKFKSALKVSLVMDIDTENTDIRWQ